MSAGKTKYFSSCIMSLSYLPILVSIKGLYIPSNALIFAPCYTIFITTEIKKWKRLVDISD